MSSQYVLLGFPRHTVSSQTGRNEPRFGTSGEWLDNWKWIIPTSTEQKWLKPHHRTCEASFLLHFTLNCLKIKEFVPSNCKFLLVITPYYIYIYLKKKEVIFNCKFFHTNFITLKFSENNVCHVKLNQNYGKWRT